MQFFYIMKECKFDSFQLLLKPKQWYCRFFYQFDNWLLDVILAFGPWVGLGLRWLSPFSDLSCVFYQIGWVFYQIAENWSILKGKMSNRDPWLIATFQPRVVFSRRWPPWPPWPPWPITRVSNRYAKVSAPARNSEPGGDSGLRSTTFLEIPGYFHLGPIIEALT